MSVFSGETNLPFSFLHLFSVRFHIFSFCVSVKFHLFSVGFSDGFNLFSIGFNSLKS